MKTLRVIQIFCAAFGLLIAMSSSVQAQNLGPLFTPGDGLPSQSQGLGQGLDFGQDNNPGQGQGQNGNTKLLSKLLDAFGNHREFGVLALTCRAIGNMDQLQVIDDEQIEGMLHVQHPGFAPDVRE